MKSIRRHLTLTFLTSFGWLLVGSGAAIYFFTRLTLINDFDANLRAKALTLMSMTDQDDGRIHVGMPINFFQEGISDVTPEYYELWLTNGVVCVRSDAMMDIDLPRRFGSFSKPVYWDLDLPGDVDGRAIGMQFTVRGEEGETTGPGKQNAILVVAADTKTLDNTLAVLATVMTVTGLLAILITVPVVSFSLRRGHAPLGQLAGQAATINADSLHARFPVDTLPEELQPIAARLNDLLARLENSFERERRFSADLAHELRTPLAELRTLTEVELAWPTTGETEKNRDALNIALQMEAMVTRLLEMARCADGKISLQLESVPLAVLMEEVWQPLASKAQERQLAVRFEVSPEAVIQTDRTLFRSILANLLANAVEYAPVQGRVEICWDGQQGELIISNSVHDLKAADVPHLFERLWRKDASRTSNEHCGLGLALSRNFATLLGWQLTAELSKGEILSMRLTAPKGRG